MESGKRKDAQFQPQAGSCRSCLPTLHARVENASDTNLSQTCGRGMWHVGQLKMKSTLADKNRLRCKLVNTFLMRHNKWQTLGQASEQGSMAGQVMSKLLAHTHSHSRTLTHILTHFWPFALFAVAFEMFLPLPT